MNVSRRRVLSASIVPLMASCLSRLHAADEPVAADAYADSAAADRWVGDWAKNQRAVAGALALTRFADPIYVVNQPITWSPNAGQAATHPAVTVPVGFVTDFASIPRAFWSALRPDGDYAYAAVIHDFLYWEQRSSRQSADETFGFAMEDFRVASATIAMIYQAVRLGGEAAWHENARLKKNGEKRVLKRLPEDPTTRWSDWKIRSDVF